jgi:uncharacterized protein YecE (DUF72 family)
MPEAADIRVGVGGWTYAPWRGAFYPAGLPAKRELEYASRQLTAIEINGTFYRAQSPASFAKWRTETPDGFVFTVKGHRAAVNKAKLAESGEAVAWFLNSGIAELGDKLGPVNWQLAPFKRFDPDDIGAFFALLPAAAQGVPIRHAIEVRHRSFRDPAFVDLAAKRGIAIIYADSDEHPAIADVTADFVYARLQRSSAAEPAGYRAAELDAWAACARAWAAGGVPDGLPTVGADAAAATHRKPRPVFIFFISGDKEKAPAAAMALIDRLRSE